MWNWGPRDRRAVETFERKEEKHQSKLIASGNYLLTGRNYAKLFTFNDYIAHFRRMNRATPPIWVRILTF